MPGLLSLYGRDLQLGVFFTPDQVVAPDVLWVAVTTIMPTPGDTGDDLVEPDDPVYTRLAYPTGADYWALTGRGGMANTQEAFYDEPSQDWGQLVGWALCSDQTGGQTFYVGELLVPERIIFDEANPRAWGIGAGGIVVKQT